MQSRRPRLTYVVTHPASARILLHGQLAQMQAWGFDVSVVCGPGPDLDVVRDREGVTVAPVPMLRGFGVGADVVSLARMVRTLRSLRPDIVNASTPKGGLLGMLAARAIGVPIRIYLVRGLRLETAAGAARAVLTATERVASACATDVIAVSRSLAEAYRGFAADAAVLGDGSSNGVDTARFAPSAELAAAAARLRAELGIEADAPVLGFVGRLVRDKGIADLLDAFAVVRGRRPSARLLVLSADLADEDTPPELAARVRAEPGVTVIPRLDDVRPFLRAVDVLGFPSYREGFPNVVLEAAALEIPTVAYAVTGVRDAIDDGVTGTLVPAHDVPGLAVALERYLADPQLARRHGVAGRARAVARFARPHIWRLWADTYAASLKRRGLPLPLTGASGS